MELSGPIGKEQVTAPAPRRRGDRDLAGRTRPVRGDLRSALRDRFPVRRTAGRPRPGVRGRIRDPDAGVRQAWLVPAGCGRGAAVAARHRVEADPPGTAPLRPLSRRGRPGLCRPPHRRPGSRSRLGRPATRRAFRLGEDARGAADVVRYGPGAALARRLGGAFLRDCRRDRRRHGSSGGSDPRRRPATLGLAAAHTPETALTPQVDQAVERTSTPTADARWSSGPQATV